LATTWVVLRDYQNIERLPGEGAAQFGSPVFAWYWDIAVGNESLSPLAGVFGLLVPALLGLLLVVYGRREFSWIERGRQADWRVRNPRQRIALWFAVVFVSCYFAGLNFDYRLIFLIIPALFFVRSYARPKLQFCLTFILLVAVWGSALFMAGYLKGPSSFTSWMIGGFQFAGDLAVLVWVGLLLNVIWLHAKDSVSSRAPHIAS